MPITVQKIGVSFRGPSLILVYTSNGVMRKRDMPLRDITKDCDCSAVVKRLKLRHNKYLETVSDIKLEKFVLLAREHIRGNNLNDGMENVTKALTINPDEDLNKLSKKELDRQKQIMDITFEKNYIGKDHPDYVHDKQVDFRPSGTKADWDDSDDEDEDKDEAPKIEAPTDTADSDDFW